MPIGVDAAENRRIGVLLLGLTLVVVGISLIPQWVPAHGPGLLLGKLQCGNIWANYSGDDLAALCEGPARFRVDLVLGSVVAGILGSSILLYRRNLPGHDLVLISFAAVLWAIPVGWLVTDFLKQGCLTGCF